MLSEPATRRDYDADRFSRADLLRRRNEGWVPGDARRGAGAGGDAPTSAGDDVAEYVAYDSSQKGAFAGSPEDFRDSMARASAKYAEGVRGRATLARATRKRVRWRGWRRLGARAARQRRAALFVCGAFVRRAFANRRSSPRGQCFPPFSALPLHAATSGHPLRRSTSPRRATAT